MKKLSFGVILTFIALAICLEWFVLGTAQILKTIFLAMGVFSGFYASEIAKKAVRSRQVANQAWAYVVNFEQLQRLEPIHESYAEEVEEWNMAITKDSTNRIGLDKHYRDKIFAFVKAPERIAEYKKFMELQRTIPGRIENNLSLFKKSYEELQNWSKYLPDEDIALLGPEILFEAITFRNSQIRVSISAEALLTYLKYPGEINVNNVITDIQEILYFHVRARVSLKRLLRLVETSKELGLWQHTKALFGHL